MRAPASCDAAARQPARILAPQYCLQSPGIEAAHEQTGFRPATQAAAPLVGDTDDGSFEFPRLLVGGFAFLLLRSLKPFYRRLLIYYTQTYVPLLSRVSML